MSAQLPVQPPADGDPATKARYRRAPRIGSFLIAGAAVGALAAIIVSYAFPDDGVYSLPQVVGYSMAILVPICAAIAGIVAIVIDRSAERRARVVRVEQVRVERSVPDAGEAPPAGEQHTTEQPPPDTARDDESASVPEQPSADRTGD